MRIEERDLLQRCSICTDSRVLVQLAQEELAIAGVESPRFEAQLLVSLAYGVSRVAVIAGVVDLTDLVSTTRFVEMLKRRVGRTPLAYIRGNQEFYGLTFAVTPETLIPRPETELLVDFAREVLNTSAAGDRPILVDVGTGTGCIAISALWHLPDARAIAVDLSRGALNVARQNADSLCVQDRIRFLQGSLLNPIHARVPLVVTNPPYIPSAEIYELQPEVRLSEPHAALDGGADGLDLIREIVDQAPNVLMNSGWLAIEGGMGQAPDIETILTRGGFDSVTTTRDLAGIGRVVSGRLRTERYLLSGDPG